jgi:hypothetical protein
LRKSRWSESFFQEAMRNSNARSETPHRREVSRGSGEGGKGIKAF